MSLLFPLSRGLLWDTLALLEGGLDNFFSFPFSHEILSAVILGVDFVILIVSSGTYRFRTFVKRLSRRSEDRESTQYLTKRKIIQGNHGRLARSSLLKKDGLFCGVTYQFWNRKSKITLKQPDPKSKLKCMFARDKNITSSFADIYCDHFSWFKQLPCHSNKRKILGYFFVLPIFLKAVLEISKSEAYEHLRGNHGFNLNTRINKRINR